MHEGVKISKASLRTRWLYLRPISYHVNRIAAEIGLRLVRFAARDSNMLSYAKSEWEIAFPSGDAEYDEMQDTVGRSIFDVVAVFSLEHHSGSSAGYTINFIEKALRFDPFSPLQGTANEFTLVMDDGEKFVYQSKRLSSVFRELGPTSDIYYDIDASPVYVEPSGASYVKSGWPREHISFPYRKPETRWVINLDEDDNEIPSPQAELANQLRKIWPLLPEAGPKTKAQRELIHIAAKFLEKMS